MSVISYRSTPRARPLIYCLTPQLPIRLSLTIHVGPVCWLVLHQPPVCDCTPRIYIALTSIDIRPSRVGGSHMNCASLQDPQTNHGGCVCLLHSLRRVPSLTHCLPLSCHAAILPITRLARMLVSPKVTFCTCSCFSDQHRAHAQWSQAHSCRRESSELRVALAMRNISQQISTPGHRGRLLCYVE